MAEQFGPAVNLPSVEKLMELYRKQFPHATDEECRQLAEGRHENARVRDVLGPEDREAT